MDAAWEIPNCDDCLSQRGICSKHKRRVLPSLKQPSWYRLVGSDHQKSDVEEMSPEARRIFNRKRTKAARRAVMAIARKRNLGDGGYLILPTPTDNN